jgi:hypothetical protein
MKIIKKALGLGFCLAMAFILLTTNAHAQGPSATKKEKIVWARDFLRAVYPALNGKNYGLDVETYLAYDQPDSPITLLRMDIGEGPKDLQKGYSGGCHRTLQLLGARRTRRMPRPDHRSR